jgi:hypothetical protein
MALKNPDGLRRIAMRSEKTYGQYGDELQRRIAANDAGIM